MDTLRWPERFRFTWECTWPVLAVDVGRALVFYGLLDVPATDADTLYQFAAFFLIGPLAVRRALKKKYPSAESSAKGKPGTVRIATLREIEEIAPGYQQAFKVYWLLGWRSLILLLPALLLLSFVLNNLLSIQLSTLAQGASPLANALGLAAVDAAIGLLLAPLLIPGMLAKRYRGFRLEVRRDTPSRLR
jgi:hypothetical protein